MTELGLTCRTFCRKLAAGEDEAATVELVLDAVLWEICRELECKPNDTRLRLLDNTRRRYCSFLLWEGRFIGTLRAEIENGCIMACFYPQGQNTGY